MRSLLCALLVAAPAGAQEGATFSVTSGTLAYLVKHALHDVSAVCSKVEGKARILADGGLQVMIRARVADFDSGNSNRDSHTLEAVEGAKFPTVEIKGAAAGLTLPAAYPASVTVILKGLLTFHGVQQPIELPVQVAFADSRRAAATAQLSVSLAAHQVERPSLMFVKVEDRVTIDVKLDLEAPAAAPAAAK